MEPTSQPAARPPIIGVAAAAIRTVAVSDGVDAADGTEPALVGESRNPAAGNGAEGQARDPQLSGCTQAQLRRFIKSRPYVPVHEIRRRFVLNGVDDDVNPVDLEANRVFVGLPEREARLLAELVRQGDVGYELLLDPVCPVIVGVFPMRPVPRG